MVSLHINQLPGHFSFSFQDTSLQHYSAANQRFTEPKGTALRRRIIPLDWFVEMHGNRDYGI